MYLVPSLVRAFHSIPRSEAAVRATPVRRRTNSHAGCPVLLEQAPEASGLHAAGAQRTQSEVVRAVMTTPKKRPRIERPVLPFN